MITIKEIAQLTGLSLSTVSIVLRGKGKERKISQDTIEKILQEAHKRGYTPNIAARSLRDGHAANQFQLAVFETHDFRASMMVRFLERLRSDLNKVKNDSRIVIFPYTNNKLSFCKALTSAGDCHAGIICNASTKDLEFLEKTALPIPIVLYNRYSQHYSSVITNDVGIGSTAAKAIIKNGCEAALILSSAPAFDGMKIRNSMFKKTVEESGLTTHSIPFCDNTVKGGYQTTMKYIIPLFTKVTAPIGIFCGTSSIAHGALRALHDKGIAVPQQCRLVTVGNGPEDIDAYSIPSLSVVRLPMEEMATNCLDLLLKTMDGKYKNPIAVELPIEYIARETCETI